MAKPGYQEHPLKERLPKALFEDLYSVQGISMPRIAKQYDVSVAYVSRLRKQYGISVNRDVYVSHVGQTRTGGKHGSLEGHVSPDEMRGLYCDDKVSMPDIAKRYGVSRKAVCKFMQRHGIQARSRYEAHQLARSQGKTREPDINDNFFSEWTPAMAWVLGLLFTDGNMSVGPHGIYQMSLSSVDQSLLERVCRVMNSTHTIKLCQQTQGGTIFRLSFYRAKMSQDLLALGITPKKSLTIRYPDVPERFQQHFIRGVFDGDGSVFLNPKSTNCPLRVHFVSGSREFLVGLEKVLHRLACLRPQTIYERPDQTSFYFKYGHDDAVKFSKFIYPEGCDGIRLERKYDKFVSVLRPCSGMSQLDLGLAALDSDVTNLLNVEASCNQDDNVSLGQEQADS